MGKRSTVKNVWPGPASVLRDTSQCQTEGEEEEEEEAADTERLLNETTPQL